MSMTFEPREFGGPGQKSERYLPLQIALVGE
jgi:hypothetical protein